MFNISSYIMPIIVLVVILYGLYKKVDIYNVFIEGSKESFDLIFNLFPCYLAMVFGINILLKSGFLNYLYIFFSPILNLLKVPLPIFPMIIMRPISGSSSLMILNDLLSNYGPDSFVGVLASVLQGSTDTTFYILTLYFGSIGIKKIRYSLIVGLLADLCSIVVSIFIVNLIFNL